MPAPLAAPGAAARPAPVSSIALVDGNNFYVSCERVFRPALAGKPVIVLSNNDGCAISRSNEAKALGVRMGQPWFQCRALQARGLVALSANFALYGDLSDRMMSIAGSFAPRQEVYSIDECFLDFTGVPGDHRAIGRALRARLQQWLGLPSCVGLGPTKTLAKLANHVAKSAERKPGSYPAELASVCDLGQLAPDALDDLLAATPVAEVWGVGRRIEAALQAQGIETALDLKRADPAALRARFSVVLEKTARELRGLRCLDLDDQPGPRQQILVSRSFGEPVIRLDDLQQALSRFASRAAEKLRLDGQLAGAMTVFLRTSPFRPQDAQHSASITLPLPGPTADTRKLVDTAVRGIAQLFRPGHRYAKAGVMLLGLEAAGAQGAAQAELSMELPEDHAGHPKPPRDAGRLMASMDALNRRFGAGTLRVAAAGGGGHPLRAGDAAEAGRARWGMRRERLTPQYTTRWGDRVVVRG